MYSLLLHKDNYIIKVQFFRLIHHAVAMGVFPKLIVYQTSNVYCKIEEKLCVANEVINFVSQLYYFFSRSKKDVF